MKQTQGFTVIELAVTVVVIGLLASIAVYLPSQFLVQARDQERYDDTHAIARRLEQAYNEQLLGVPSYPTTQILLSNISSQSGAVDGLDEELFRSPSASSSSVVAATTTNDSNPNGSSAPSITQYTYQPIKADGSLCNSATVDINDTSTFCTHFTLFYRTETDNSVVKIRSINQQ